MRIIKSDGTQTWPAYPKPEGGLVASYALDLTVSASFVTVTDTVTDITETGLYLVSCWLESYNLVGPPAAGTFGVEHKFASAQGANRVPFVGPIVINLNALDVETFSDPVWCVAGTPITVEYDVSGFLNPGNTCDVLMRTTVSRLL